jgi:hypothetical protein
MGLFTRLRERRREREERERAEELAWQREEEEARRRAEEEMPSPFSMLPFGSLLEQMMLGGGGWARSYELDPRTGEWVDVSDRVPEPPPAAPDAEAAAERFPDSEPPPAPRRAPRRRPRPQASSNPLASLLGGGMPSGGGGDFEVQPPDALTTFDDVGGMDAVKQEVRDTVGLILEHPEQAERYGI